jgi:hypothetical protein
MSPLNRRDFLKGGSIAVAAAGVASAMPIALPTLAGASGPKPPDPSDSGAGTDDPEGQLDQPLVAHVRSLDTGEIGLFYGDREITYQDRKLAAQLHRAAK